MESAYSAIEARAVPVKKKIPGGALLIAGAYYDHVSGFENFRKTLYRIELIKMYESGALTLKQLNRIW